MGEVEKLGLPPEVLIPKQECKYTVTIIPRIIKRDVQVSLLFKFEGLPASSFLGSEEYSNSEAEDKACEAISFIKAAQRAWVNYRRSEKRSDFVQQELSSIWKDLEAQKLTHKKLKLDKNSDEIVIAS